MHHLVELDFPFLGGTALQDGDWECHHLLKLDQTNPPEDELLQQALEVELFLGFFDERYHIVVTEELIPDGGSLALWAFYWSEVPLSFCFYGSQLPFL